MLALPPALPVLPVLLLVLLVAGAEGATFGPVLGGYDVVAYQTTLGPGADGVRGVPAHAHNLLTRDFSGGGGPKADPANYTFWFASESNRAAFAADPWRFAPKFGGF